MAANILVVGGAEHDVKLCEALLLNAYFDVTIAENGEEAVDICLNSLIDIIILKSPISGIDGLEICSRLKDNPQTSDIPILMLSAIFSPTVRIQGYEAGIDEIVQTPVSDAALISQIKKLTQFKNATNEFFRHADQMGDSEAQVRAAMAAKIAGKSFSYSNAARFLIVEGDKQTAHQLYASLAERFHIDLAHDAQAALIQAIDEDYDAILLSADNVHYDAVSLCAQLRRIKTTRLTPIILIADENAGSLVMEAMELGVNDYLMRPIEKNELFDRLQAQIKRKSYNDLFQSRMQEGFDVSVTDSATGLFNRQYVDGHMPKLFARALRHTRPLSIIRIEFMSSAMGGEVLREFVTRIRGSVRHHDIVSRYGENEIVLVLPDVAQIHANKIAERVHQHVSDQPFLAGGALRDRGMVMNMGIATYHSEEDSVGGGIEDNWQQLYARAEKHSLPRLVC